MLKNPLSVSYQDLIDAATERLRWMEQAYPRRVLQGSMTSWAATHGIEVQRRMVKLLKKFKKDPQLDLLRELQKTGVK